MGTMPCPSISNALKNGTVVRIRANTTAPNEPYTALKGILPMSQPPTSNPWQIDQDHALGILKKGDSKATASKKSPSLSLGLVTMAIAAVAAAMACFHFGTLIHADWGTQQDASARTELARIKSCINH